MRSGVLALAALWSSLAAAQAATDRTTNLSGDWIGAGGTIYFNLIHRFESSAPPERKITNSPTFLLAGAVASFAQIGTSYATNSTLAPRFPNEHEYFVRFAPLRQHHTALDAGLQIGYNDAARGADGELAIARALGRVRLLATGRLLHRLDAGGYESAYGGGAVLRLSRLASIAADATTLATRGDGDVAWGVGLQFALPQTPHTMSLHLTNVSAATLQGTSRGGPRSRYGFEYTIPITLRRYAPQGTPARSPDPARVTPSSTASGPVTQLHIHNLAFTAVKPIAVGTTVEWINDDPLPHSVVAADSAFQSPLIQPGGTWRHTFSSAGTYMFSCSPHPFMRGTIVVR